VLKQEVGERSKSSKNPHHDWRDAKKVAHSDRLQPEEDPVGEASHRTEEGRQQISSKAKRLIERFDALPRRAGSHLLTRPLC